MKKNERLNAICPYFAMFPLEYPLGILRGSGCKTVLDPFCGRGTTNMAARLSGVRSFGIDSSRVAYAIASSKIVDVRPVDIIEECRRILDGGDPSNIPEGEFWRMMYSGSTLVEICKLREALLDDCSTPERIALRGIMLGALHGPLHKDGNSSYLSNQFPRTYASKPAYSVRFWKARGMTRPPVISVADVVSLRSNWYYSVMDDVPDGRILNADSLDIKSFSEAADFCPEGFDTVITSPPYMDMYTYIPDQWIRNWFVGGPPEVDYSKENQIHNGRSGFVDQIRTVWKNCIKVCNDESIMHVRFGKIGSSDSSPEDTIHKTFDNSGWEIQSIQDAGQPIKGRRQSDSFLSENKSRYHEIDVIAAPIPR